MLFLIHFSNFFKKESFLIQLILKWLSAVRQRNFYDTISLNNAQFTEAAIQMYFKGKKCYENMQQIYKRTPMLKCDLIKLFCKLIEIILRHGCSPVSLLHILRTVFLKKTSGRLLLNLICLFTAKSKNILGCYKGKNIWGLEINFLNFTSHAGGNIPSSSLTTLSLKSYKYFLNRHESSKK